MSKKKTRAAQSGPVWHRSAEEATLDKMPKYNAHICRSGPHGSTKYDRAKVKRDWQREMSQGIARTRGRFPFSERTVFALYQKGQSLLVQFSAAFGMLRQNLPTAMRLRNGLAPLKAPEHQLSILCAKKSRKFGNLHPAVRC